MIPEYWDLSAKHTSDIQEIINKHYVSLYEFYEDEDINSVLRKYIRITRDINVLAKLTEFYAPLKMDEGKYIYSTMEKRLVIRLFKYYFYSALYDLVSLKDDDEVLIRSKHKMSEEENKDIPMAIINNMMSSYEIPTKPEGFDEIINL